MPPDQHSEENAASSEAMPRTLGPAMLTALVLGFVFSLLARLPGVWGMPFAKAYDEHLAPVSSLLMLGFAELVLAFVFLRVVRTGRLPRPGSMATKAAAFAFVYVFTLFGFMIGHWVCAGGGAAPNGYLPVFLMYAAGQTFFALECVGRLQPPKRRAAVAFFCASLLCACLLYLAAVDQAAPGGIWPAG